MNKLVTKTPIQRFLHERYNITGLSNGKFYWQKGNKWYNKQGKEVKGDAALKELKFAEAISKVEKLPKSIFSKINDNGNRYFTTKDGKYNIFQNGEVWDTKTGKKVEKLPKSNSQKKNVTSTNTSARTSKNTSTGISKSIPVTTRNNSNNSTGIGRFQNSYANNQNLFGDSGEFAGQTIRQVQQMLGVEDDGIWGPQTQAAYENWKAQKQKEAVQNQTYTTTITPERKPVGDYSNRKFIKSIGIRNYGDLINLVKSSPDHWLSKDLTLRFGDVNNWNQNDVERLLNVSGTYRGGKYGDIDDITKSQAKWAANYTSTPTQVTTQTNSPANIISTTPTYTTPVSQIPSDWRSGRNINWIGYFRNQLKNNYRPLYMMKKGGLVFRNPIKRFQANFKF